jgi:hypothetical protein
MYSNSPFHSLHDSWTAVVAFLIAPMPPPCTDLITSRHLPTPQSLTLQQPLHLPLYLLTPASTHLLDQFYRQPSLQSTNSTVSQVSQKSPTNRTPTCRHHHQSSSLPPTATTQTYLSTPATASPPTCPRAMSGAEQETPCPAGARETVLLVFVACVIDVLA